MSRLRNVVDVARGITEQNSERKDVTVTAVFHNSQRTEGASLLNCINSGFTEHENSPTKHPIQEESEQSATGGASDQKDGAAPQNFEHYLVSDKIKGNRDLQNMLAYYLDRTSQYAIKTWEDLASTEVIGAPLDIRRKCKLSGQKSFTLMLFELLASDVNYRDKKVRELIDALHEIHQEAKGLIEESPAYKSGKENFLNKKISEFVDDVELIDDMATCLDQTSLCERTPFWRLLATKLGVPKEKLDEIEHCEVNSTKFLMGYYYSVNPNVTIEQFYEVVETQLKRDDVLKILDPIAKKASGKELRDVLKLESDEMTNICVLLNKPKLGKKNWESLADILRIPRIKYQQFSPAIPESPTNILLEWIFYVKEKLTVGQLISALRSIDRNDVVEELRKHFLQHSTTH